MVEYGSKGHNRETRLFRGGMAQLVRLRIKKRSQLENKTFLGVEWSNVLTPVVHPHQAIILPDNTYLHPQIKEYL